MVSVILIIEAFEHVVKNPFLDFENVCLEIVPFSSFHLGGWHVLTIKIVNKEYFSQMIAKLYYLFMIIIIN